MACEVKIIEDSVNPYNGVRLTTFQLRYWRSIHAELMTHRMFSRNASSSRAIPISTFLKQVWNEPASPIHWGANIAGMQAKEELKGFKRWFAISTWNFTGKVVCSLVWLANKVSSPHKQTLNRLLEPWQYISVIVSATEWDNWYELRDHEDAQPEIRELAHAMKLAHNASTPVKRDNHLPYVTEVEKLKLTLADCMKISTARCARVSYLTHDGQSPDIKKDIALYDRLVGSRPLHASPCEHPATAFKSNTFEKNFKGWRQHRYEVEQKLWMK